MAQDVASGTGRAADATRVLTLSTIAFTLMFADLSPIPEPEEAHR